jgi:hypothetical protein
MEIQHAPDLLFYTEPTTSDIFELMAEGFSMLEERLDTLEEVLRRERSPYDIA